MQLLMSISWRSRYTFTPFCDSLTSFRMRSPVTSTQCQLSIQIPSLALLQNGPSGCFGDSMAAFSPNIIQSGDARVKLALEWWSFFRTDGRSRARRNFSIRTISTKLSKVCLELTPMILKVSLPQPSCQLLPSCYYLVRYSTLLHFHSTMLKPSVF